VVVINLTDVQYMHRNVWQTLLGYSLPCLLIRSNSWVVRWNEFTFCTWRI